MQTARSRVAEPQRFSEARSEASPSAGKSIAQFRRTGSIPIDASSVAAHAGVSTVPTAGAADPGRRCRVNLRVPKIRNSGSPTYGNAALPSTQPMAVDGCRRAARCAWRAHRPTGRWPRRRCVRARTAPKAKSMASPQRGVGSAGRLSISHAAPGKLTLISRPPRRSDRASVRRAPCSSAIDLTIASPSPLPVAPEAAIR